MTHKYIYWPAPMKEGWYIDVFWMYIIDLYLCYAILFGWMKYIYILGLHILNIIKILLFKKVYLKM